MECPVDGSELEEARWESDYAVDRCPRCGGIWLDRGELEAIEETRERDYADELLRMPDLGYAAYELARQKRTRQLTCPSCEAGMETREYARCSQVMIDVCPKCHGVWLDRGELESLEIFFQRSRLEASPLRRAFLVGLRYLDRAGRDWLPGGPGPGPAI
ncbi:MAG TPA: zf-TFIIB domain-containing protein [Gammaproteobacteria bacterium]|nr:zf-TFIIB domain-containing protein [Gammaproteobacteria bacterium]